MKKLRHLAPEMSEAVLGEYTSRVEMNGHQPIYLARQVALLLENGISAIDDSVFEDKDQVRKYLQSLDDYTTNRLGSRDGYRELNRKSEAIGIYKTTYREVVANTVTNNNYTRAGVFAHAFPFTIKGQKFMARHMFGGYGSAMSDLAQVDKHFDASVRARGVPGIEQLQAISYSDGVTVAPFIPGKRFRSLSADEMGEVQDSQVASMYHDMKTAEQRGVGFDGIGSNLLFDAAQGFTWIDLAPADGSRTASIPEDALSFEMRNTLDSRIRGSEPYVLKLGQMAHVISEAASNYDLSDVARSRLAAIDEAVEARRRALPQQ